MARPDVPRPDYVSVDLAAPIVLRLRSISDQRSAIALFASRPTGVVLTLCDDPQVVGMSVEGRDLADAFKRLLPMLAAKGLNLHACGGCSAFRFSSMSYQMSGGQKGYCTIKGIAETGGPDDVVCLLDRCDAFAPRAPNRSWFDEDD